jgi:hypothetical protein
MTGNNVLLTIPVTSWSLPSWSPVRLFDRNGDTLRVLHAFAIAWRQGRVGILAFSTRKPRDS